MHNGLIGRFQQLVGRRHLVLEALDLLLKGSGFGRTHL